MLPSRHEINEKLQELVGEQLDEIRIGQFWVQLCFHCVSNGAYIMMGDNFSFDVNGMTPGTFDIDYQTRDTATSSANFGLLSGAICHSVDLNDARFHIVFEDSGSITLDLPADAFECLQIQFSGVTAGTLGFMAVV